MKCNQLVRGTTREELRERHDTLQRESSFLISAALMVFLLGCFFPHTALRDKTDILRWPATLARSIAEVSNEIDPDSGKVSPYHSRFPETDR